MAVLQPAEFPRVQGIGTRHPHLLPELLHLQQPRLDAVPQNSGLAHHLLKPPSSDWRGLCCGVGKGGLGVRLVPSGRPVTPLQGVAQGQREGAIKGGVVRRRIPGGDVITELFCKAELGAVCTDVEVSITERTVRVRLDKNKPQTFTAGTSTSNDSLFLRDRDLLDGLRSAETMLFEFTPFHSSPVLVTFDLAGLEEAMWPLELACNVAGAKTAIQ